MTPQDNKSWSEEFDEKFSHTETCRGLRFEQSSDQKLECFCSLKDIKSFIHSTLNKEREEERNRLVEKVEKREVKVGKGSKKYGGYRCNGIVFADMKRARAYKGGYNQAIENILTILKENNK